MGWAERLARKAKENADPDGGDDAPLFDEMPKFNEDKARQVQADALQMVRQIEAGIAAAQRRIATPDDANIPKIDPEKVLIGGVRQLGMAVVCILDLLLEMRTGRPGIIPVPKPDEKKPC